MEMNKKLLSFFSLLLCVLLCSQERNSNQKANADPIGPPPSADACFLKVEEKTWKNIRLFYLSDDFELRFADGPEVGTITALGPGWSLLWSQDGQSRYFVRTGDAIVRVNNCLAADIVRMLPSGSVSVNPYLDLNYASLVDVLVSGDREAVRRLITEIEIRRGGKTLILHPSDMLIQ